MANIGYYKITQERIFSQTKNSKHKFFSPKMYIHFLDFIHGTINKKIEFSDSMHFCCNTNKTENIHFRSVTAR